MIIYAWQGGKGKQLLLEAAALGELLLALEHNLTLSPETSWQGAEGKQLLLEEVAGLGALLLALKHN